MTPQAEQALIFLHHEKSANLRDGRFLFPSGKESLKEAIEECIFYDYADITFLPRGMGVRVSLTKEGLHAAEEMISCSEETVDLSQEGLEINPDAELQFEVHYRHTGHMTANPNFIVGPKPYQCMKDGGYLLDTTTFGSPFGVYLCTRCGTTIFTDLTSE